MSIQHRAATSVAITHQETMASLQPSEQDRIRIFADHHISDLTEHEAAAKEKEQEEELAQQIATQEHIFSYPDGSVYMGHMRCHDNDDGHKRHGRGTLRTPAFVYGEMKNYTSDEAAENAHLAKWHEYSGTWENDKLHGHGVHVQKSGDGGEILIFEGVWEHGKPNRSTNHYNNDGGDGDGGMDDSVFGW